MSNFRFDGNNETRDFSWRAVRATYKRIETGTKIIIITKKKKKKKPLYRCKNGILTAGYGTSGVGEEKKRPAACVSFSERFKRKIYLCVARRSGKLGGAFNTNITMALSFVRKNTRARTRRRRTYSRDSVGRGRPLGMRVTDDGRDEYRAAGSALPVSYAPPSTLYCASLSSTVCPRLVVWKTRRVSWRFRAEAALPFHRTAWTYLGLMFRVWGGGLKLYR